MNRTQTNVMANNAIMTPPPAAKATAAPNRSAANSDLEWRPGVAQKYQELCNQPAHLPDLAEESKRARAEKRLNASLRRMEIEEKAVLLAETQQKTAEARRKFESSPPTPYDHTPRFPSTLEDMFQAEKERNELLIMEKQQKEVLLRDVLARLRDQWPQTKEIPDTPEFDHVPRFLLASRETMDRAFEAGPTVRTV